MAAADRVEIRVRALGGHAAQPHLSADAILCAAQIVTAAHTLVARRIDPNATAVLSLTRISGGQLGNQRFGSRQTPTMRNADATHHSGTTRTPNSRSTPDRIWRQLSPPSSLFQRPAVLYDA